MYDYFNLVELYEKSKKEINKLKCKNYDLEKENNQLKEKIYKAIEFIENEYNTYPSAEQWRRALKEILKENNNEQI